MAPVYEEAAVALRTVRDLVRFSVTRLGEARVAFGHGGANAWDESVYLVLFGLGLPLDALDPFLDARVVESERRRVLSMIEARARHVPAAYVTREAWLGDMSFYVDERVIVPRSFIAELLFENLDPWIADPEAVTDVLDLCTGSGCLALIAERQFSNAQVDAVDISADALAVTRINMERHASQRVHPHQSDLFAALDGRRYDLIVCNPPYVPEDSMQALPQEYREEPRLALAGGTDGMDVIRRILSDAPRHLKPEGGAGPYLVVEVGHERAAFELAFPGLACTWLATQTSEGAVVLIEAHDLRAFHSA